MNATIRLNRMTVFCVLFTSLISTSTVTLSQQKYSPDHPEVEPIVDRGISFLKKSKSSNVGVAVLSALAIVEARKRYYQEIPSDDPIVQAAIAQILKMIPQGESGNVAAADNLLQVNEVYIPSLAIILLAEVDQGKYKEPIKQLLKALEDRQESSGAFNYNSDPETTGDTSQTQYAALALFVAKQHGFKVNPEAAGAALGWLTESQLPTGGFVYKLVKQEGRWNANAGSPIALPIHAAGLSTVYLLADLLQLNPRKKSMAKLSAEDGLIGLPKTVTIYVRPLDGEESLLNKTGPLVRFDMGRLGNSARAGNALFENMFTIQSSQWNYYYLYALERYAWFREQAEGDLGGGKLATWYDQGVEYLKKNQKKDGSFLKPDFGTETAEICTAFAVLFLVRSSEVITSAGSDSELAGGIGFPTGQTIRSQGGDIVGSEAEKNLASMIDMLEQEPTSEQLEALTKSLKNAVVEFKNQDDKSRGEIKSFLRTMISAREYFRRKIAVRFLAGEQDMDNVPALVFALGDPDFRVCIEAHDGLRLISRKIDSLSVTNETRRNSSRDPGALNAAEASSARSEFDSLKKQWAEWFLKIRPSAEMLD